MPLLESAERYAWADTTSGSDVLEVVLHNKAAFLAVHGHHAQAVRVLEQVRDATKHASFKVSWKASAWRV